MASQNNEDTSENLGYIRVPKGLEEELGEDFYKASMEPFKEKAMRKIKDNPFVPIGLVATVLALTVGLRTLKTGDRVFGQKMMRARVAAQGFTVLALVGGIYWEARRK